MRPAIPKPTKRATEKRRKQRAHASVTSEIRTAVMERAGGRCEACGDRGTLALDHWLGGSGRRREQQSTDNTWGLCLACDSDRTHNRPSAAHWNEKRRVFCGRMGLPFTPHIEKQPMRRAS